MSRFQTMSNTHAHSPTWLPAQPRSPRSILTAGVLQRVLRRVREPQLLAAALSTEGIELVRTCISKDFIYNV